MERILASATQGEKCRCDGSSLTLPTTPLTHFSELPAGTPKLKANEIVGEVSKAWNAMDVEMKVLVTNPFMEDLATAREEMDTKAKLTPVHVLNDVSATIGKIKLEVCPFIITRILTMCLK
jgi:pseudouridine-5'-phosphate glycosidase